MCFIQPSRLQKELLQVSFWVFTEQLLYHIIYGRLLCYEVTIVKKCAKPLQQESETKIFDQKIFIKKSTEKNKSGVSRINQIMSKLLTLIKR